MFHSIQNSNNQRLRIGVIGLGNISRIHLQAFRNNPQVTIAALADNDPTKFKSVAGYVSQAKHYFDYRELLKDRTIDVVDILLPHSLHARVVIAALEAGKHVICEKPLATSLVDIEKIQKASERYHKRVYLKQYFRFSTLHQKIKDMILGGEIGKPYFVSCLYTTNAISEYNNLTSWRGTLRQAGGGIFMDVGVHMIDFLTEIFGYPRSVSATMKKNFTLPDTKGEDLSVVVVEFRSNVTALILCTAADTSFDFRWEKHFFGQDGSLHVEDIGKKTMIMHMQKNGSSLPQQTEENWWDNANTTALADIITRIYCDEPPAISLDDSMSTLKTILCAYKSAHQGKKLNIR